MGMLKAFNVVALDIAKAKPMLLAAGVSQALITTAAGLIVGIPAMMAYAYFRGRTSKLLSNLETASADLLTLLIQKPKS
jgi:biopolymer transport protein ExbB